MRHKRGKWTLYSRKCSVVSKTSPAMPDQKEVLVAYQDLLTKRGVTTAASDQLCRMETVECQWQHVCLANAGTSAKIVPKEVVDQLMALQYRRSLILDNLVLLRHFIARCSTAWIQSFVDNHGLESLQLFLPRPSTPALEFNVSRGHAILQVFWRLCHFYSALEGLSRPESSDCVLSLCLCLSTRHVAIKIKASQILRLISLASVHGSQAVDAAFRDMDRMTRIVHVVSVLLEEPAAPQLHEEVFCLVNTLLEASSFWLREQLGQSESFMTLVEQFASDPATTIGYQAKLCLEQLLQPSSISHSLHRLLSKAKQAHAEDTLLKIVQVLMDTSSNELAWNQVALQLATPPPVFPLSPRSKTPRAQSARSIQALEHPTYSKYFKMLQVKVSEDLVRQRMIADGVDACVLATPHATIQVQTYDEEDLPRDQAKPQNESATRGFLSEMHTIQVLSVAAKLPFPLPELPKMLETGDLTVLTRHVVDKLLVLLAIPTGDEKQAIQSASETTTDAERAVKAVLSLAQPLTCWQIFWQFPTHMQEIHEKCQAVLSTCGEIHQCQELAQALQILAHPDHSAIVNWKLFAEDAAALHDMSKFQALATIIRDAKPKLTQFGSKLRHLPKAAAACSGDLHALLAEQHTKIQYVVAQRHVLNTTPWTSFLASAQFELRLRDNELSKTFARLEETVARCFGARPFPRERFFPFVHHLSLALTTPEKNHRLHISTCF
ncbi:hypothetical protein AeNC1_003064 [Aphanomyces euteiches]|nr:hypothetical protein AeNC1_003064 [Aphanomyces euteiches]